MFRAFAVALFVSAIPICAHAVMITIEPDAYAAGTNLSKVTPGISLNRLVHTRISEEASKFSYEPVYSVEGQGYASTGSRMFSDTHDGYDYLDNLWCYQERGSPCGQNFSVLVFRFASPTDFVSVLARQTHDTGWMFAYDASGAEVAACQKREMSFTFDPSCTSVIGEMNHGEGIFEMFFAREVADIASVVMVESSGPVGFDRFRFNRISTPVPEPGTLGLLAACLLGVRVMRRRRPA